MLSQPFADAINNSISKGVFSDNAKIASIFRIDKQSYDKNKVSNFRPSVLNTFSRIYESVIKYQLISVLNNVFSPYLAAYRESYIPQHPIPTRLLEEWKENLDNNFTVVQC